MWKKRYSSADLDVERPESMWYVIESSDESSSDDIDGANAGGLT